MAAIDTAYLLRLLRELTAIDSVLANEGSAATYLAGELRALGLDPGWDEVLPGRPNITASLPLGRADRFLVFSGHHDTVPATPGWTTDPFRLTSRDGRLYGLGVHNMKAGLACQLAVLKAILAHGPRGGRGRLGFASAADHEGTGAGARALLATEYGACDAMLHGEHFYGDSAGDYLPRVVTGKLLVRVIVQGRAGHAFRPHDGGINAIDDAARIVAALPRLPLATDPELGSGNTCVLKIDGGYREYAVVVPERCEIVINRLIVPGESVESAVADLRALIDGLGLASTVTIETPPPSYPPYRLDLDAPVADCFRQTYAEVLGAPPVFAPHTGGLDANIYAGEGRIPTVVFGPKGANHHRPDEYVVAATLEPVARIYAETALRFLAAWSSTSPRS